MAIFGPKPWVNPFGRMLIFRVFKLLVFIAQKGVFSFQNILKDIFLAYIAEKKQFKIGPFLYQNHELTPLEKCQLFTFLNLLYLQARKTFFRSRISQDIFLACIDKKTNLKKIAIFGRKPWINPIEKMSIFRLFELFLFKPQKGIFSFQNIVQDIFLACIS